MSKKANRSTRPPESVLTQEDVDPEEREARCWARQIDELDTLPEDPRATRDRVELERWNAFAAAPWARPETIADAVERAEGRKTIWLLEAVDLMAFGAGEKPQDDLEAGARRLQACRALCGAAAEGAFPLVGILGENSERLETIATAYFDSDYRIGRGSNVLELDGSGVPERDDAKFDRLHIARWFDVRIGEKERFLAWASGENIGSARTVEDNKPRNRQGQGSFEPIDGPLLDEMQELIAARKVTSVQAAAASVADRAHGNSTFESKTARLAISYRKSGRPSST